MAVHRQTRFTNLEGNLGERAEAIFNAGLESTSFAMELNNCAIRLKLAESKPGLSDEELEGLLSSHWQLWEHFRKTGNSQMYAALEELKKRYPEAYNRFLAVDEEFFRETKGAVEKNTGGLLAGLNLHDLGSVSLVALNSLPKKVINDWKNYGFYLDIIRSLLKQKKTRQVKADIKALYNEAREIEDRYAPIGLGSYLLMKLQSDFPQLNSYVGE